MVIGEWYTNLLSPPFSQGKVRDGQQIQSRVRALDSQYKSLVSVSSSRFSSFYLFPVSHLLHNRLFTVFDTWTSFLLLSHYIAFILSPFFHSLQF